MCTAEDKRKRSGLPESGDTADVHMREILEEARLRNPEFVAGLRDSDRRIYALELKLTTVCTLRCRDCSHLNPYVPNPAHFSVEEISDSLDKLLKVSKIAGLILLGGEVLLHPGLPQLLSHLAAMPNRDRIGFIRVTTNGTVVPSDGFCEAFRQLPHGYVHFSNYGSYSRRQTEAAEKLSSYGISYETVPPDGEWRDLGGVFRRNRTEEEVKHLFRICHGRAYLQLYRGHLYHCFRGSLLNEEGLIPRSPGDYLDIQSMTTEELAAALPAFSDRLPYMESCYYCDGSHPASPRIPAAIQLTERRKQ